MAVGAGVGQRLVADHRLALLHFTRVAAGTGHPEVRAIEGIDRIALMVEACLLEVVDAVAAVTDGAALA